MSASLTGKMAVVTGAANGIGRASALRLVQDGASIALLDRDREALDEVAGEIRATGREVQAFALDCTDSDAVVATFAEISQRYGHVDILVNNVGQGSRDRMQPFLSTNLETLEFQMAINLKTCIVCSHQVVKAMAARGYGKIINMTSESAVNGSLQCWDYSAVKAGVIGFTRALAREMAPYHVNVNAIGPGATRTRALDLVPAELMKKIIAGIPMQRIGEPEEIANAVSFFAGSQSDYITGQTLLVNGGNWML